MGAANGYAFLREDATPDDQLFGGGSGPNEPGSPAGDDLGSGGSGSRVEGILRQAGVSDPETIDRLNRTFVHKADVEGMRTGDKEQMGKLGSELSRMQGVIDQLSQQVNQNPSAKKSPVDEFLDGVKGEDGDDESRAAFLSEFAGKILEAAKEDTMNTVAPVFNATKANVVRGNLDAYMEQTMVATYGEEIRQAFPYLRQQTEQLINQGQNVLPDTVMLQNPQLREWSQNLLTKQALNKHKQRSQRDRGQMSGFQANDRSGEDLDLSYPDPPRDKGKKKESRTQFLERISSKAMNRVRESRGELLP